MATPPTPDLSECRNRQQRLRKALESLGVQQFLATRPDTVCWLTGVYLGPLLELAALVEADGSVVICLPDRKADTPAAADRVVSYQAKWLSTMRNDQAQACISQLLANARCDQTVGGEFSRFVRHAGASWDCQWIDVEPTIWQLRRRKHSDELAMMAWANQANRQMYERARELVRPGVNELDVYSELYRVAVSALGEPLTYFGQDFRSGARGGPPRDRRCEPGELYILDLGVGYRGYYSDNARTLAVDGNPNDQQQEAWRRLADVFGVVQETVRPGASCQELFRRVQQMLAEASPWVFDHHLGHGVGLAPHEGPHLNPNWDETFEPGDFFTVEPGLYHEDLRHGIRLEQNYVVTDDGVKLVTDWPLELA